MRLTISFPNVITAVRILLTPLVVILILSDDPVRVQVSGLLFVIAAVSDWYDGWYARRYNAMSPFGRFFDPLADKILIGAVFFAFVALDLFDLWMVIAIVARDVLVTLLRVLADLKKRPVVTSSLAKFKTALQLVFLAYIVGVRVVVHVGWISQSIGVEQVALLASRWVVAGGLMLLTVLSIVTMVQYVIQNRHVVRSLLNGSLARTTS